MAILTSVDRAALDAQGRDWLDYFAGLERYVVEVYRTEDVLNRAKRQYAEGDVAAAQRTMAGCHPEKVIESFAQFSRLGGLTRGEQGLIVTMNTRWLTHTIGFRQQVGLEPVRYNFGATSHDPLAQSRGIFTFHFDRRKNVWQTLGTHETGRPAEEFLIAPDIEGANALAQSEAEICRTAIVLDAPLRMTIRPIMSRDRRNSKPASRATLPPGRYRLTLLTAAGHEPDGDSATIDVDVTTLSRRITIANPAVNRRRVLKTTYDLDLPPLVSVDLIMNPVRGRSMLCGLTLQPL
jgi:hypothetical protein